MFHQPNILNNCSIMERPKPVCYLATCFVSPAPAKGKLAGQMEAPDQSGEVLERAIYALFFSQAEVLTQEK